MFNFQFRFLLPAACLSLLTLAGCADKNKNGMPDSFAPDAGAQANKMLEEGKERASEAGQKIQAETKPALEEAQKTVSDAVKHPDKTATNISAASTITPKVKAAFYANDILRPLPINVSTVGTTKTILLTGSVKSQAQKVLATKVAQQSGSGYKVQNNLKVKG